MLMEHARSISMLVGYLIIFSGYQFQHYQQIQFSIARVVSFIKFIIQLNLFRLFSKFFSQDVQRIGAKSVSQGLTKSISLTGQQKQQQK